MAAWSTTFRPGPGARMTDRSSIGTASTGSSASRARTAEQSTHVHSLAPPGAPAAEYNTAIDPIAAQVVLDDSDLVIWQIPRNSYREALASSAEMQTWRVTPLGAYLVDALAAMGEMAAGSGFQIGETYALGDSPLVLLTALQSSFEAWPSSSRSQLLPAPVLDDTGAYTGEVVPDRTIRVWSDLDTRLLMADLNAKLT